MAMFMEFSLVGLEVKWISHLNGMLYAIAISARLDINAVNPL